MKLVFSIQMYARSINIYIYIHGQFSSNRWNLTNMLHSRTNALTKRNSLPECNEIYSLINDYGGLEKKLYKLQNYAV